MPAYIETTVVGGQDLARFSDIYVRNKDGNIVINNKDKDILDLSNPIQKIEVQTSASGSLIAGIALTYTIVGKDNKPGRYRIAHGKVPVGLTDEPASAVTAGYVKQSFDIGVHEKIAVIFGRAGFVDHVPVESVLQIGFVTHNKQTGNIHTYGPFGGSTAGGTAFHFSGDIIALGGFANPNGEVDLGLSGLTFFRKVGDN